jgi:rsbT antagonist protein RsbS
VEIPILRLGDVLVATVQGASSDGDLRALHAALLGQIARLRPRGVVVDVTALDVVDSFACRTLSQLAQVIKLRGARTVVVGLQPEVAMSMVQMGLTLGEVPTALDLEDGVACLDQAAPERP